MVRNAYLSTQVHISMGPASNKGLLTIKKEPPQPFACIWLSVEVSWQTPGSKETRWCENTNKLSEIRREILRLVTFPYSGVPIHSHANLSFITSNAIPSAIRGEHPISSPIHGLLNKLHPNPSYENWPSVLLFTLASIAPS